MVAIFWYAFWSCFIPLIAMAPQDWFTAFELQKMMTFLPDAWIAGAKEGDGKFHCARGSVDAQGESHTSYSQMGNLI